MRSLVTSAKCIVLSSWHPQIETSIDLYDVLTHHHLPVHYQITRVTFGVAASPFAAIRTLQQIAIDFGTELPLASPHVSSLFYVDDFLAGAQNVDEAITSQQQLRALLLKGGFNLRMWRPSSMAVMNSIPSELHETTQRKDLVQDVNSHPKALGIHWDAGTY